MGLEAPPTDFFRSLLGDRGDRRAGGYFTRMAPARHKICWLTLAEPDNHLTWVTHLCVSLYLIGDYAVIDGSSRCLIPSRWISLRAARR